MAPQSHGELNVRKFSTGNHTEFLLPRAIMHSKGNFLHRVRSYYLSTMKTMYLIMTQEHPRQNNRQRGMIRAIEIALITGK